MTQEILFFVVMLAVFIVTMTVLKLPISLAMAAAAVAGSLVSGNGLSLYHLVEGTFSYLSTIMTIATAMIFMKVIERSGALNAICSEIIEKFHNKPVILLLSIMAVIMFPGMITGSSTAAVLSAGSIMAPVLMLMGVPALETAAVIALGGILGKVAPPVNVAAMIIGAGADVPYVGFAGPLLLLTVPPAIFTVLFIAYKYVKNVDYQAIRGKLDTEVRTKYGVRVYIPIFALVLLIVLTKVVKVLPDTGMPLLFMISATIGCFTGQRFNPLVASRDAMQDVMPVLGNLMGVGMFIQVMTLNGVRGMIVTYCLIMPVVLRYIAMGTIIPAFGGVSSLGTATVFGIPFILAFLGNNELIVASALSMLAAVGDIMPPSALAGAFATRITGVEKYSTFLKVCLLPAIIMIAYAILMIIFANQLAVLF